MRYGYRLLIIFILNALVCFAEEKIPTLQENREKAEKLLFGLDLDLSRFLSRREMNLADSEKFLKEEGVWSEEEGAWNRSVKHNEELQKRILKQKTVFVAFRDNLAEIISLNYEKSPMGEYEASMAELDITEWYVNFLKQELMW